MEIENIRMLSKRIMSADNLTNEFKELFGSDEAKKDKNIVYFLKSNKPLPRVKGESDILYIGSTTQNLYRRYFSYSATLASGCNEVFYKYIISNFGGLCLGYITCSDPKATEAAYFKKYYNQYLEYPPKSKIG